MNSEEGQYDVSRAQNIRQYDHYRSDSTSSVHGVMSVVPQSSEQMQPDHQISVTDAAVSIAIDPVALITTECITVTSAMRKHTRWAQSSVSAILGGGVSHKERELGRSSRNSDKSLTVPPQQGQLPKITNGHVGDDDSLASRWGLRGKRGKSMQDNPLMSAFARLRHDLRGCRG